MTYLKWTELSDLIIIRLDLPSFEINNINLDEKSLYISGESNNIFYKENINFLHLINSKKSSGKITDSS